MTVVTPPFPTNPTLGQYFGSYVWNGNMWIVTNASGMRQIVTVFKASGVYTPSPGLVSVKVECIGGGGGGGDAASTNNTFIVAGGGGGSGGWSSKVLDAALVLGGVLVTIGAGGGPDAAGQATSFGTWCIAYGGSYGIGNNGVNLYGGAGAGAPAGVGDIAYPGASGDIGVLQVQSPSGTILYTNATGGLGGVTFGGNVALDVGVSQYSVGASALPNTGAGGTGACINQSTHNGLTVLGGSGGSGLCVVTESVLVESNADCCGQARVPITDNSCLGWR